MYLFIYLQVIFLRLPVGEPLLRESAEPNAAEWVTAESKSATRSELSASVQSGFQFSTFYFSQLSFLFYHKMRLLLSNFQLKRKSFSDLIHLICLNLKCIWTRLNISYLLFLCFISIYAPEQPPCDCGGPVKFTDFQPRKGLLLHRFSLRLWNISSWRLWGEIWNHKQERMLRRQHQQGARTVGKKKINNQNS